MTKISMHGVTIDAAEPERLAVWWGEALGWIVERTICRPPDGWAPRLEFMPVTDPKRSKNRVHVDLGTIDVQAAVDRLVAMGATVAWEEEFPPEWGDYRNVVLRDPEGNEFCVGGPPGAGPPG